MGHHPPGAHHLRLRDPVHERGRVVHQRARDGRSLRRQNRQAEDVVREPPPDDLQPGPGHARRRELGRVLRQPVATQRAGLRPLHLLRGLHDPGRDERGNGRFRRQRCRDCANDEGLSHREGAGAQGEVRLRDARPLHRDGQGRLGHSRPGGDQGVSGGPSSAGLLQHSRPRYQRHGATLQAHRRRRLRGRGRGRVPRRLPSAEGPSPQPGRVCHHA
mmetsp:Transcript_124670/g.364108  ORF Transcript_124670/g.364108 Transcript_124670/m.364108 type:complete len:217 (-) Transcript_124670:478-1128(-)